MTLMSAAAFGQQLTKMLAEAQQTNAAKLREYSWKSRTEIRKGGETRSVQLNQVRFDLDGSLQKTMLSETKPDIPTGGLRGMIAKKKKEEFLKTLDGLGTLAESYGELSPEKMRRFIEGAIVTTEKGAPQKLLRIQSKDVLRPGDTMTFWIDAVTRKQRKIEIQTVFDGNPLRIVSEFRDLPNGPTYMARSLIDYPENGLTITTDNFEYTRSPLAKTGGKK